MAIDSLIQLLVHDEAKWRNKYADLYRINQEIYGPLMYLNVVHYYCDDENNNTLLNVYVPH